MDSILDWDKRIFLFFNGFHKAWLDPIMLLITETVFWTPLYFLLIYLLFKKHKGFYPWLVLIMVALTITITDQITSTLMKPYFERLRPSHEPDLANLIHVVDNYRGGTYGFASGHAANTFATATFFWLLFRKSVGWIWTLFIWAALMTYTRIYLGVHYPGDVLIGAMTGALFAWLSIFLVRWISRTWKLNSDLTNR